VLNANVNLTAYTRDTDVDEMRLGIVVHYHNISQNGQQQYIGLLLHNIINDHAHAFDLLKAYHYRCIYQLESRCGSIRLAS